MTVNGVQMLRHIVWTTIGALMLLAALAYLRDPPWILTVTSGMRPWETDAAGARVRWMGGHASFFVPATSHAVEIPVRATFDRSEDSPIVVTIALDDRPVDRIVLADADWRYSVVRLPAPSGRRARRFDIRVDRTREGNNGAAIGEIRLK